MSHAEKCPICGGSGVVWVDIFGNPTITTRGVKRTCHGCNGRGWVVVP